MKKHIKIYEQFLNEQKKIKVDDLYKWKNEEDPIVDGPYWINKEHFNDFLANFTKKELDKVLKYVCKKDVSELKLGDFAIGGGGFSGNLETKIMTAFVDTLNKYNYKEL